MHEFFIPTFQEEVAEDMDQVMDYANRSMTLPMPPKPQRTQVTPSAVEQPQDEWAEKLYGKGSGSLGSSDSLKRRSWEPAPVTSGRVPIESGQTETVTSRTSSPVVVSRTSLPVTTPEVPQPLPRHSMESVAEGKPSKKAVDKEKENKFTKKLKYLRDFGRGSEAATTAAIKPTLSGQFYNNQSERIIIGHENDVRQSAELPKEVVQRYEGKTREVRGFLLFSLMFDCCDWKWGFLTFVCCGFVFSFRRR